MPTFQKCRKLRIHSYDIREAPGETRVISASIEILLANPQAHLDCFDTVWGPKIYSFQEEKRHAFCRTLWERSRNSHTENGQRINTKTTEQQSRPGFATKLRCDPQPAAPSSPRAVCLSCPRRPERQHSTTYPRPRFPQGLQDMSIHSLKKALLNAAPQMRAGLPFENKGRVASRLLRLSLFSKSLRQSVKNMLKGNERGAGTDVVRDSSDVQEAKTRCLGWAAVGEAPRPRGPRAEQRLRGNHRPPPTPSPPRTLLFPGCPARKYHF